MPVLHSFTLVSFSHVILICVRTLLNAEWASEESHPRPHPASLVITDTSCTQTPKHHKFPLKASHSATSEFLGLIVPARVCEDGGKEQGPVGRRQECMKQAFGYKHTVAMIKT